MKMKMMTLMLLVFTAGILNAGVINLPDSFDQTGRYSICNDLGVTISGDTAVYLVVTVNYSDPLYVIGSFNTTGLGSSSQNNDAEVGQAFAHSAWGIYNGGKTGGSISIETETPTVLVMKVDQTTGKTDLFVNPDLFGDEPATPDVTRTSAIGDLTAVWYRGGNDGNANVVDRTDIAVYYGGDSPFVVETAWDPDPEDGAMMVKVDQSLNWAAPNAGTYTPAGYDVWIGTEPNVVSAAYDMTKIESMDTDLTAIPGTLAKETTYYWYVDAYEPNEADPGTYIIHSSDLWSFTTEPASVYYNTDGDVLVSQTVDAGEEITFTVDAANVTTYQWYKDDIPIGSNSETLTISDVQLVDEGFYYCEVSNSISGPISSQAAQLMTKRLVAHWAFDGDLTESVSNMTVTVVDPNTEDAYDAVYDFGTGANSIVGSGSLYLDNSDDPGYNIGGWLQVDDSADLFNFYPQGLTISTWVKTPAGQSGEFNEIIAKYDETVSTRLFHRVGGTAGLFRIGSPGVFTGKSISDGQWHLFVSTYDPETGLAQVSLDGAPGNTFEATPLPNTGSLLIGGSSSESSQGWIGWIDEVQIYNYPRTAEEVAQEYYDVTGTTACVNPDFEGNEYDFDGDCKIDLGDFAVIAENWLNSGLFEPIL